MRLIEKSNARLIFDKITESYSIPSMNDADFEDTVLRDFRLFLMDKYGDELYNNVSNDDVNEYFTGMFYDIWDNDDLDSANAAEDIIRTAYHVSDTDDYQEYDDGDTNWAAEEEADAIERMERRYGSIDESIKFTYKAEVKDKSGKGISSITGKVKATDEKDAKGKVHEILTINKGYDSKDIQKITVKLEESENLNEDSKIWSNHGQEEYYQNMTREEMIQEIKDNGWDEEEINGKPILDADDEELRDYLIPYDIDLDFEDYEQSILPMIEKQCYGDYIVLCGIAANWRGKGEACKAIKVDELQNYFFPNYDATIQLYCNSHDDLYYTEANHDTPMGGTEMYLYSFLDETDYNNAEATLKELFDDEDFDMYYFCDYVGYKEVSTLIEKGLLKPVKRDPQYVGITESIKLKEAKGFNHKMYDECPEDVKNAIDNFLKDNEYTKDDLDEVVYEETGDNNEYLGRIFIEINGKRYKIDIDGNVMKSGNIIKEAAKPKVKKDDTRVIMQQGNVTCIKENETYLVFENEADNEVEHDSEESAMQDFMERVGIDINNELIEK